MRVYVADTNDEQDRGMVHVYDLPSGEKVDELETGYLPTVAASARRRRLFVASTHREGGALTRNELVVYDARSLRELARHPFADRFLYNVAPTGPEVVATDDGDTAFLVESRLLGDDQAEYGVRALDVDGERFEASRIELPLAVNTVGLAGRKRLFFDLSGRAGEAVGTASLRRARGAATAFLSTAGPRGAAADGAEPEPKREPPFLSVGAAAAPDGSRVYHVTREGEVRVLDTATDELSEPLRLTLPEGMAVPLQQVLAAGDSLYVGVSGAEDAARGLVELVYEYRVDGGLLFRRRAIGLAARAEKLALSPEGDALVALSRLENRLDLLDLETLEVGARVENVGVTPVQIAVSS